MGGILGILLAVLLLLTVTFSLCRLIVLVGQKKSPIKIALHAGFAIVACILFVTIVRIPVGIVGSFIGMFMGAMIGAGYGFSLLPKHIDFESLSEHRKFLGRIRYHTVDVVASTLVAALTLTALRPGLAFFNEPALTEAASDGIWIALIIGHVMIGVIALIVCRSAIQTLNRINVTDATKRLAFIGLCSPLVIGSSLATMMVPVLILIHFFEPSAPNWLFSVSLKIAAVVVLLFPIQKLILRWALTPNASAIETGVADDHAAQIHGLK